MTLQVLANAAWEYSRIQAASYHVSTDRDVTSNIVPSLQGEGGRSAETLLQFRRIVTIEDFLWTTSLPAPNRQIGNKQVPKFAWCPAVRNRKSSVVLLQGPTNSGQHESGCNDRITGKICACNSQSRFGTERPLSSKGPPPRAVGYKTGSRRTESGATLDV